MADDEPDLHDHVALCPVTDELAGQIAALADVWHDTEAAEPAMSGFGWGEPDDTVPMEEVHCVTNQGHFVFVDAAFYMPFAFYYTVGGGVSPEDPFAPVTGWSVQRDAERDDFYAVVEDALKHLTNRLGRPDHTTTVVGYSSMSAERPRWRYAMWRRNESTVVVGPKSKAMSYHQFEEATVVILPLGADAPFPEGDDLHRLLG